MSSHPDFSWLLLDQVSSPRPSVMVNPSSSSSYVSLETPLHEMVTSTSTSSPPDFFEYFPNQMFFSKPSPPPPPPLLRQQRDEKPLKTFEKPVEKPKTKKKKPSNKTIVEPSIEKKPAKNIIATCDKKFQKKKKPAKKNPANKKMIIIQKTTCDEKIPDQKKPVKKILLVEPHCIETKQQQQQQQQNKKKFVKKQIMVDEKFSVKPAKPTTPPENKKPSIIAFEKSVKKLSSIRKSPSVDDDEKEKEKKKKKKQSSIENKKNILEQSIRELKKLTLATKLLPEPKQQQQRPPLKNKKDNFKISKISSSREQVKLVADEENFKDWPLLELHPTYQDYVDIFGSFSEYKRLLREEASAIKPPPLNIKLVQTKKKTITW